MEARNKARKSGNKVKYKQEEFTIVSMKDAIAAKPDIAIFSAGGNTSLEWAPKFAAVGTTVVDNSSAWRMDPTKKLIVPEINGCATHVDRYTVASARRQVARFKIDIVLGQ